MLPIEQLKKLAKLIEDSEKLPISLFAMKLSKASESYPEDQTIGMISDVVARMSDSKLFITRAEVKDLYKKLYSRNTKFAQMFADELGEVELLAAPKLYVRPSDETELDIHSGMDQILSTALNNAFGNSNIGYTADAANNAKSACIRSLSSFNATVEVANGKDNMIVCRASFETPKGMTNILIPIEITANQRAMLPSAFVGNAGPEDLNDKNIKAYILSNAGKKLNVSDALVLNASLNTQKDEPISSVDLALTKLNATKENHFDGGILGQKVAKEVKNAVVKSASYNDPEVESFAKMLDTPAGVAGYRFTDAKVKLARDVLAKAVSRLGLKDAQLSIIDSDYNTIRFAVATNNIAFKVSMSFDNGNISLPSVLISNGSIESFSIDGINNLMSKNAMDHKTAAFTSPNYSLKASELVNLVRSAMQEGNYSKAEDALNILEQSGDTKAYITAFQAFTDGLGEKEAVAENKCSFVIKHAHSSHPICGHTNLPLHKVHQDKHGNCMPNYRKGMNETYEGAYFSNSKILL